MKITLEFDTESATFQPDELLRVQKANNMAGFIFELEQRVQDWYRNKANEPLNEDTLREFVSSLLYKYDIIIEQIYP
jgi:hypothetical protein